MADAGVLASTPPDYFGVSSLRRSYSGSKISTKHTIFRTSSSTSRINEIYHHRPQTVSESESSSAPPSPRTITDESTALSSPKSLPDIPLSPKFEQFQLEAEHSDDQISLPEYGDVGCFNTNPLEDLEPPLSPGGLGDSYTASPNDNNTSTANSRPESPEPLPLAEDDTAIRPQPSRHVDYLSHDWREEDIWESWKYIVSRRGDYANSARLENASWRTWMKSKYKLKTISPESLNWLKDCDVTWLYGPLQTGSNSLVQSRQSDSRELTKSNSFLNKKPILKKRSVSEIMLQKSLSTSSLVREAVQAVQAQQMEGAGRRPGLQRAATDHSNLSYSSHRITPGILSALPSASSSGVMSPTLERKHIHFNEQVEQCIAVEVKGEDEEDDVDTDRYRDDSDSDDGAIMMKKTVFKKRRPILKRKASPNATAESKTIAMLPSTTLKYRNDTPEPPEAGTAMKHSYRSPLISPSSSQETLRPSKGSGKLFFAGDDSDDDEDEDEDENDVPTLSWRSSAPKAAGSSEGSSGLKRSTSSGSLAAAPVGMRRTESGMLMPYEEGEPAAGGIVGRVIDTVNTARDIAHVIWNVGWRK